MVFVNSNNNNNVGQSVGGGGLTPSSSRPHRAHQRSNSILNASSISTQNPLTMLNTLNFNRDYGNYIFLLPFLYWVKSV